MSGPLGSVALDAHTATASGVTAVPAEGGQALNRFDNRGFAVLGDRLFLATLDSPLVALNAKSGNVIFDSKWRITARLFVTLAPLALDGKIIVGVTAGECALTGFMDAYDAATGKRLWRTNAFAQPGDPNRASWAGDWRISAAVLPG